jgi:hypothetical protein
MGTRCPYQGTKNSLSGHSPSSSLMFWLLSTIPAPQTACLQPTDLTSLACMSVPCPTHPDTLPLPFPIQVKLLLCRATRTPVLVSCWFTWWLCESPEVSFRRTVSQWELRSTLQSPSCFLYNPNFQPASYSACHLLSHWYLARHIRSWSWRQYVLQKHWLTFNRLHDVICQKIVPFK